jgi:16S rRNA (adenine1518-N6/adenine1519-N6)-dimethyltransferase
MNTGLNFDSPSSIRDALASRGIALKKRWGQNFLVNRGARVRILDILHARSGETIWEIGPGLGVMTEALIMAGTRVVAFEIDRGLCRYLRGVFRDREELTLVQGDFLKTWKHIAGDNPPAGILGNLPYSSASLMIAGLAEEGTSAGRLVFTVQKELAERILAKPGTKAYSSFSVLCQVAFEVKGHGDLKPGSFYPAPEVVSSIIELQPHRLPGPVPDRRLLSRLTRALFASRRKTLRNNLIASGLLQGRAGSAIDALLEGEGLEGGARAEELPPEAFYRLAQRLLGFRGSTE